jgi:lysophospholipase L1-like esterase
MNETAYATQPTMPQPPQLIPNQTPKKFPKKLFISFFVILFVILGATSYYLGYNSTSAPKTLVANAPTPTPIDESFGAYTLPQIPKKDVYIIFMVGDSMTEALGPFGGKITDYLNELYESTPGNQRIVIDNYAKGSTNLLGLMYAMKQPATVGDKVLDPIMDREFDLILIESFGYNPLSQLGLQVGLKQQEKTLDELMKLLTKTHPNSAIVFVATIAPNKANYDRVGSPGKTLSEREAQVTERMEYIKNHMAYAKEHNTPLIDIYTKSLTPDGTDGEIKNINPDDHIHPSFAGVDLISNEIAKYIYDNQILRK